MKVTSAKWPDLDYWYEPKFVVTHKSDGSPRHPDDMASDPHASGMVDKSKPLLAHNLLN